MPLLKENHEFWTRVKELAQKNIKSGAYEYFIDPAQLMSIENDTANILVESSFHKDYWRKQSDLISTAGFEVFGKPISYALYAKDELSTNELNKLSQEPEEDILPAKNNMALSPVLTGLNGKYTFENFVQGPGNRWTLAAAVAVADKPGDTYNPLFIYGGAGLGKTHLMHAIGNEILTDNPNAKVKYVSSENFVNDYVNATRKNQMENFEHTYRNLDLLLLDDVQFFSDKEGTKTEFFNTFNTLYEKGAQIVLTSDRIPQELNNLEERLVSRFSWGLTTDITAPDYETRMAILLIKSEASNLDFPSETLSYIAGQIDSNVRELEGALNRVEFVANANNVTRVDIETASQALRSLKSQANQSLSNLTIKKIQDEVAKYYHISISDLIGPKRPKEIAFPRQIAMYLVRELLGTSLPAIGNAFGGRDHTTVMYAYKQISDKMKNDIEVQKDIDSIKRKFL
ncbi:MULTISPECIES: chromosomal replication initiator protein DnaA [unclassified Lactococcus]|uniref:chromosomal replication initiator protein DnaA n=1 Tax=unclassified Lactococcus TaxID=2643510 RepID=UPI0011CBFD5F|nr:MULTISPECIES: chromosomal replication initiator protein DnaA [unclassified Lactococcus]MQW22659.1 chromosomal replication initiator protein DnaA [Lactococcus sp. dk101]TXK44668.1 chromosomal replication initiator protein DnaA [Lactococcus sp. dk310]TXK50562.1 chromosomal replication initiator protein DnaA [Lactococcus sp. dk322]